MPGRPILREHLRILTEGGQDLEDQIFVWIATGTPMRKLAELCGLGYGSTAALYKWRRETPERLALWNEALKARAEFLAEETLEIADDVDLDPEAIRKAELQTKARQWLASVSDRERFGKDAAARTQVNIGTLHLTAVKEVNAQIQADALKALRAADPVLAHAVEQDIEDAQFTVEAPEPVEIETPIEDML